MNKKTTINKNNPFYRTGCNLHHLPLNAVSVVAGVSVYPTLDHLGRLIIKTTKKVITDADGWVSFVAPKFDATVLNCGYLAYDGREFVEVDVVYGIGRVVPNAQYAEVA